MPLTDIKCKSAKFDPNQKPNGSKHKLTDGGGLYLHVMKTGKYWRLKYRYQKKEKLLALGVYPQVTLAEARNKRDEAKKLLEQGIDPSLNRKEQRAKKQFDSQNTFEQVARKWHQVRSSGWTEKYAGTILNRLEIDVFPKIGNIPIRDITPTMMLDVLLGVEKRGVYETTRRIKQYCRQIYRYAVPLGLADRDVTFGLEDSLKTKKVKHHASIEPDELPQFLSVLHRNQARMYPTTRLAVEFMLHTFVRTDELIKTRWDELNIEEGIWIISGPRMKMKKSHIVPLSKQTLAILEELRCFNGNYPWVFASPTRPKTHMSNNSILMALRRMGYQGKMTGHGFRSLALTILLEKLGYPFDVADAQLAHSKKNAHGEAYDRAKYLEQRKTMMQDWSDYIDRIALGGDNIIEGRFSRK